ncbi:hypothetical protein WJX75_008411 [Coccomyxa subellipsoidea]|uniref:Uncharacterized protein n=1 Tax=Coccomyxa subellipsoidea TaxID=248742 RepID=A0ABR2YEA6_9CHLO
MTTGTGSSKPVLIGSGDEQSAAQRAHEITTPKDFDDFGLTSGSSAVNILTQAATFTAIGLAAWFSARLLDQAPEQREDETGECPRCSGSGGSNHIGR